MPTDYYKPRFKRHEGGYLCSYGGRTKKLEAVLTKGKGDKWSVTSGDRSTLLKGSRYARLKDAKADWGRWAANEWCRRWGDPFCIERRRTIPPPPRHVPRRIPPPPIHHPGPKVARRYTPPPPGQLPPDLAYEFASDPFNSRHKYPATHPDVYKNRQLTPLGTCIEVWAWLALRPTVVGAIPALGPVLDTVKECVRREDPDAYTRIQTMIKEHTP